MSTQISGGNIWKPEETTVPTKRNEKLELALFGAAYFALTGTGAIILLLIAYGISNLTQQ